MIEFEADDALATAADGCARARVERVFIRHAGQGPHAVRARQTRRALNRRARTVMDEAGVVAKLACRRRRFPTTSRSSVTRRTVPRPSRMGAKSAAAVLARFGHIEAIPNDWRAWHVNASSPAALADVLSRERDHALLFRTLATLRTDIALFDNVDALRWTGPTKHFKALGEKLDAATSTERHQDRKQ